MTSKMCLRSVLFALPLLIPGHAFAESYGYIPSSSVYLGSGFSPLAPQTNYPACLKATGECQMGASGALACINEITDANGTSLGVSTTFKVKQIESKYDFFREVNIQASLSGSYGPFSGSASFSSYSLDDIKENSLTWVILAKSSYGSFALRNPTLQVGLNKLKVLDLVGKCGSNYVSSVDRGVIAAALFSVYNLDERHRRELQAKMSVGFSTAAIEADGKGSFSDVMKTALQYGTMTINVFTIGGEGAPGLSEAIKASPTDLKSIKEILANYVSKQDAAKSAIVSFRTTGLGKLIDRPDIDPDQSYFVYFLEDKNELRLKFLESAKRASFIIERKDDFDSGLVNLAQEVLDKIECEVKYIETAIQACRMSFEQTNAVLLDGDLEDDIAAGISQRYAMTKDSKSRRMEVCSTADAATKEVGGAMSAAPISAAPLKTFGWARSQINVPVRGAASIDECSIRTQNVQRRLTAMIESALASNAARGQKQRPKVCISGCEAEVDLALLSSAAKLPKLPFEVSYWFEPATASFPGATAGGLYITLKSARNVKMVRAYVDQEFAAFGARVHDGSSNLGLYFSSDELKDVSSSPVRLEVESTGGQIYTVDLPKLKPI
ncbi:hypothetical protein [Chelatococcus reniformis]|uniref:Uncharacterized protein n=1 Tax=Chelatococcus reniformis TaxID=1494448 RepID=A0A916UF05_9HYPH|nr:hypothetical protein [Chelatococcus reniformis]GGC71157.1 hypothetical protein GCM10010994_32070 [Chelatococcus reniformis]